MPIESEWTNFSSEDRAFMDQQIQDNMEIWHLEQEIQKTAKRYRVDYAQWKDWDDNSVASLERIISAGLGDIIESISDGAVNTAFRQAMRAFDKLWPLCKYALERKALSNKQKKFALDVIKRMGTGVYKAFRGRGRKTNSMMFAEWVTKWQDELFAFRSVSSMRDVEVGSSDTFQIDGITIHNSVGASDRVLQRMGREIQKATRYIKGGNYNPMKKTLYGHAHLVSDVGGHNTLGFYNPSEDNVYVRTFLRGSKGMTNDRTGYIHVLIHELGHRCFKKFITNEFKNEWRVYYNELKRKPAQYKWPLETGDQVPFSVKGHKGETIHFAMERNGYYYFYGSKDPRNIFNMGDERNILRILTSRGKGANFPSNYSMTNYEEFYCETVAFYLRGDLSNDFMDRVKSLFGIAQDEPTPQVITNGGNGDQEQQEQSEKSDLSDKIIDFIVRVLQQVPVSKVGDKWVKKMGAFALAQEVAKARFVVQRITELLNTMSQKKVRDTINAMIEKAVNLGFEQGKFESDNGQNIYLDVTDLYKDEDNDDSVVEQRVREIYASYQNGFFLAAKLEQPNPYTQSLTQIVSTVGRGLMNDYQMSVDVSVISDIVQDLLDTTVSMSATNTVGAFIRKDGSNYLFYNIPVPTLSQEIDLNLFADYMENNVLENLGKDDQRTYTLDELVELVDMALEWGSDQMVSDRSKKISAINEYINSDRFKDLFVIRIRGTQYIITRKPKEEDSGNPDTAPKEKSITFEPINELQTKIMKEICALLKGGSGDLTASDVFNSIGDDVGITLRGFGRSMGKLVRLNYLCPNGKCPKGSIYKLSETGKEWCKINGVVIQPKDPPKRRKRRKNNTVENALVQELRSLYQLVQPKGDQDSTDTVVAVGKELKASKSDKLSSLQVTKLSAIITKLDIDLSSLPLLKAQLIVGESADDESVTPLVMELRKLYVDVRKQGVSKRSLTILTRIALKVKEEDLNEITGDDLSALERLVARAELSTSDYPIIFKVVEQGDGGDTDTDKSEEDFPSVTEVMKIILRIMGQNIDKEESASSIRTKVNKFPDTNVTTKGLGRSMGALVRYGYLSKEGNSPSGATYKGTALLARWYSANTPQGDITDLGKDILRVLGNMPNVGAQTSKQIHTILSTAGADVTTRGVGRSMGKLATDGWLTKVDKASYLLSDKGQQWFYSDLAS